MSGASTHLRHLVQPDGHYHHTLSPGHAPVLEVEPGERIVIETVDAFHNRLQSNDDLYSQHCRPPFVNPVTGPVFIQGAEPGDALSVKIHSIEPTRDFAVTALVSHFGALTTTAQTAMLHEPLPERTRVLPLRNGRVEFGRGLSLPMQPFLGTLGVAPELEAITSLTAGPWGGNLDCVETGPGREIRFPVFAPGALFFVGDAHAVQGDGELTGVAAEMPAAVQLEFGVLKGAAPAGPRILSDEHWMTTGSARPLEDAVRIATRSMVDWLVADGGMEPLEAYEWLGLAAELRVGNVVDPAYTVVLRLRRDRIPSAG